ncbi:hypothetical protein [Neobacillus paridis]
MNFPKNSYDYASSIDKRVILIDDQQFTDLMFKYIPG